MRPLRGIVWACALGLVGAIPGVAGAAWCNVFQVCCASCGGQGAVSGYYSGYSGYYSGYSGCGDACCPQPTCTTRYVQRCYYQPVTCYQSRSYYEAVTSYRTSYYYEPVTTYRYSYYTDPCTGCCQQTACPQTCYQLRSQCCPVQSWVQRCCQVPVTSYQKAFYWEPVTSCCAPQTPCCAPSTPCCPTSAPCNGTAACADPYAQAPVASPAATVAPPAVSEQQTAPPAVGESTQPPARPQGSGSPLYDRYYPSPNPQTMPGASYRPNTPRAPAATPAPAPQPPTVRLDHIVALPETQLNGQVVRNDNVPQGGARLVFISAARQTNRQAVTADAAGRFRVTLPSGGWYVYLSGADNRPVYHSRIDVREQDQRQVTLVSR